MNWRLLALASIVISILGCASAPPYVLPPNTPHANLMSSISGAFDRRDSIYIYIVDYSGKTPERKELFLIRKSTSKPEGYVKVPAGAQRISYHETASGGRQCDISMVVDLQAGKNYSLVGGFEYEKGPIPILTGTRKCSFGLRDDATGLPVPYR